MDLLLGNALYFLALINPASKVFLLSSMEPRYSARELLKASFVSTMVAGMILFILAWVGNLLLHKVFHVEIYSLKVAGGIVLFTIGLMAVSKGRYFERELIGRDGITIVPLAAPLIAGPGTITAAISFSAEYGLMMTALAIFAALAGNFVIMLMSLFIGRTLERFYAIGPLIRISGLIVAAVAVQMILSGIGEWYLQLA